MRDFSPLHSPLAPPGGRAYAWGVRLTFARPLLLAVVLASSGCGEEPAPREWRPSDHQEPSGAADSSQAAPVEGPPEATLARAAAALYAASCAGCHGEGGRGDGMAAPPGTRVPDLTAASFQGDRTDAQIAEVIREGRGLMPGFGGQINERGIAALVAHVRTLRE